MVCRLHPEPGSMREEICHTKALHPDWPNNRIARLLGCSPPAVSEALRKYGPRLKPIEIVVRIPVDPKALEAAGKAASARGITVTDLISKITSVCLSTPSLIDDVLDDQDEVEP